MAATPLGSFLKRSALARFNPNGTLDSTFGTGGLATDNPAAPINEIAVQADNLWDTAFQEIPAVPASPRQFSGSVGYAW